MGEKCKVNCEVGLIGAGERAWGPRPQACSMLKGKGRARGLAGL